MFNALDPWAILRNLDRKESHLVSLRKQSVKQWLLETKNLVKEELEKLKRQIKKMMIVLIGWVPFQMILHHIMYFLYTKDAAATCILRFLSFVSILMDYQSLIGLRMIVPSELMIVPSELCKQKTVESEVQQGATNHTTSESSAHLLLRFECISWQWTSTFNIFQEKEEQLVVGAGVKLRTW